MTHPPIQPKSEEITFMECDTCRAKPGMPTLCSGCLHNRAIISNIQQVNRLFDNLSKTNEKSIPFIPREEEKKHAHAGIPAGNCDICIKKGYHTGYHESQTPTPQAEESIQIVPSPRIDYCGACKKDHGYDCPLDTPSPDTEWETKELEILASIEHDQWIEWSKSLVKNETSISGNRRERWAKLWVPYTELSEESKEQYRTYARIVLSRLHTIHHEAQQEMYIIAKNTATAIKDPICLAGARTMRQEILLALLAKLE